MMTFVISVRTLIHALEHTFLQCPVNVKFYHEILSWFNVSHNTLINLSPEQILIQKDQKYIPGPTDTQTPTRTTHPVYQKVCIWL